jgi:hypothetical protein
MPLMLQECSAIRYDGLRENTNAQIASKLEIVYHGEVLRIRAVEKLVARFRRGQETFEDEVRSERHSDTNFADAILRFLEKNSHSSSREIRKTLYSPKALVLRVLYDFVEGAKSRENETFSVRA